MKIFISIAVILAVFSSHYAAMGSETIPFKVHKFLTAYDFSDLDIPSIASQFDIIDTYLSKATQVTKIKELNPFFRAIYYKDALTHREGATEDWYVHDAQTGSKLVNKDWGWYLMDIGNQTYRISLANSIKAGLTNNPMFDGVFLDDVWGTALLGGFYREGTKETGVVPQLVINAWHENMKTLLNTIKTTIGSKLLIINASDVNTDYLALADGQMDEAFCHANWQTFGEFFSTWQRHLNNMIAGSKSGKIYLAQSGIVDSSTVSQVRTTSRYCFAMFLLGANDRSYFYFSNTYRGVTYFPEWDVDLGNPIEDYHARSGTPLYEREYSKGLVLINPSAGAFQISLAEKYKNLDGVTTDTMTLGSHEGEVLLKILGDITPPSSPKGLKVFPSP